MVEINVKNVLKSAGRHIPFEMKENDYDEPIRVAVTGAAGQIGGYLCNFIA